MTAYITKKSQLQGIISIPTSKSQTLRAILFGSLGKGKTLIHNYLPATDTDAMLNACTNFGATIKISDSTLEIQGLNGKITQAEDVIYAGNSGLVLRFCSAIGALASKPIVITGDASIKYQRPMQPLLDGLKQLGVSTHSMRGDNFAPVIIHGPLQAGKTSLNGEDSQPVSAILMACSFANGPSEILVKNPGEKPWVALTLNWLDKLGISYQNHNFEHFFLKGNAQYEGFEYTVPGDLSSAAFPIAAALVTHSELTIDNVDINDMQGDKELIYLFQKMGAHIDIDENQKKIRVKKGKKLIGIDVDINNFIDSITILAVVATFSEGTTRILNGSNAKNKECNRIHCIAKELRKMGSHIEETEDGLIITGSPLQGALVNSYNDHRMAMSLCVAGLAASGETKISSTECIDKTFPQFFEKFNAIGANIQKQVH